MKRFIFILVMLFTLTAVAENVYVAPEIPNDVKFVQVVDIGAPVLTIAILNTTGFTVVEQAQTEINKTLTNTFTEASYRNIVLDAYDVAIGKQLEMVDNLKGQILACNKRYNILNAKYRALFYQKYGGLPNGNELLLYR